MSLTAFPQESSGAEPQTGKGEGTIANCFIDMHVNGSLGDCGSLWCNNADSWRCDDNLPSIKLI